MRLRDGRYECSHCGHILDIPLIEKPRVVIRAMSGKPNVRSLELDGREIHSCVISPIGAAQQARRQSTELRARAAESRTRARDTVARTPRIAQRDKPQA